MHEWSIAEAVCRAAVELAKARGAKRIVELRVRVGELAQLDLRILREALGVLAEDSILQGARIEVEVERAEMRCNKCGYRCGMAELLSTLISSTPEIVDEDGARDLPLHYYPGLIYALGRCPRCGSRDFEVRGGRSVEIERVVVER